MSTFETLIVIILGVYTLGSMYFAVTARILNRKNRKEDMEIADKSLQWEEQLKTLTTRMGQLTTENERVMGENRKWKAAYDNLAYQYQELLKKQDQTGDSIEHVEKSHGGGGELDA